MTIKQLSLPTGSRMRQKDFLFGVATSSFQIEGAADQRLPNIWDTFCEQEGNIADGSNGQNACQHIDHWQNDVELIHSLNVDAYRLSIAWPRVMHKDGSVNETGMAFYQQLVSSLNDKGIKVFVTLYHWDLPQYLEDNGGWCNRDTAYAFANYADTVSRALGDNVYAYSTLNEPFCSAYLGYELGIHAPGHQSVTESKQAAHHLLLAHGLAMNVLRRNCPNSQHGIVVNISPIEAASSSNEDQDAAAYAHQYLNSWYIDPILKGVYPDIINQLPDEVRPSIGADDMQIIAQPIDYLGINYYTRERVKASANEGFELIEDKEYPTTEMGWEIYPQGLYNTLTQLTQDYDLPPVYITENGAATDDHLTDGLVHDDIRIQYFQKHLEAVNQAMEDGVDIRGYFAWSLMDNFEWAEGYLKRFGLVYVNYANQERILKDSAIAYQALLSNR